MLNNRSLLFFIILLLVFTTSGLAQQSSEKAPKGKFLDLKKVDGWGPFMPRDNFEATHLTGTFSLMGTKYSVFVLHDEQTRDRIVIRKTNTEVQFTEKEGAPVYYSHEYLDFDGIKYKLFRHQDKKQQLVMLKQEKGVAYAKTGLPIGSQAKDITDKTTDGENIQLSKIKDKYILLDFWGTWCGPCLQETPFLKKAYEKYGDRLEIIGIAVDNNPEKVRDYIKENDIEWPNIIVPRSSPSPQIVQEYNVYGYPELFLIDPSGEIIINPEKEARLRGDRLLETLSKILDPVVQR